MKPVTWLYVGAVILLLMSACGIGLGGFIFLGSTDNHPEWVPMALGLACFGGLALLGGGAALFFAVRKTKAETAQTQNVTLQVDLPGDTKISQMKCQSCGGAITSNDIKIMAGAPVVTCPYCQATYQLTEEPKW
jgi:hypothetical protein